MGQEKAHYGPFVDACGDRVAGEVAARQGGAISSGQLRAAGLGSGAIKLRVRRGRLHPVHHGVYALGHPLLSGPGRLWAAVLAANGVLSHRTAAAMWDLIAWPSGPIDVTTLRQSRPTPEIRVHRCRLEPHEITTKDGLPITTPMRALLDLATTLDAHRHQRAVHRAAELHLLDASLIPPQRRGARRLRTAVQTLHHDEPQITKSELEERFLELVAHAGLPRPLTNHRVEGLIVDAYWPDEHLVVELDSRRWHLLDPRAFEDDRRRDVALRRAGYEVVRFTWRQVTQERGYVVETLRAYLP